MQRLWIDHVFWTRAYVAAFLAGSSDEAAAAVKHLMGNQEQIGATLATTRGPEVGAAATGLLKEHISIAVKLLEAIRTGNRKGITETSRTWDANANKMADLFASLGGAPVAAWRRMMRTHLVLTKRYILARVAKKWDAEVVAVDAALTQATQMAAALSAAGR